MPGAVFLRGERLCLRTIAPEDYEFVHKHWNDPSIRYGAPMPTPFSKGEIGGFVENADDAVQFLPCDDGSPVGYVMLFDIEKEAGHGELGYWIVPDERGNGYATEAADLCLKHAFDDRGLHKVLARVFEGNDGSIRVLEKLGFEQEGLLREQHYVDGKYADMRLYGLLASER
jgi:RimJ/RimL family protein N-acetyltransferase